jgi:hypothetical protein
MGTAYNANIVTDSLVLCLDAANPRSYPGSGTNWYDLSGNGNHSNLTTGNMGSSNWNNGVFDFDGSDEYIEIANSPSIAITNNLTMSIWIRPEDLTSSMAPFLKQWCNGNQFAYFSIINTDGTLRYAFDNDGSCSTTTGDSTSNDSIIQINNWYNISITHTSSGIGMYINGESVSFTFTGTYSTIKNSNRPFRIGGYQGLYALSPDSNFINGKVSSLNMYNKALSAQEIRQNFNATRGRYGY